MIRIGGWSRLSTCDWPGRLVTTLFCQGCPWRCGYCHNPTLLNPRTPAAVTWPEVRAHLRQRQKLVDGVVFSGGEPLLQRGLAAAMKDVRELGFAVGLHTGGAYPRRFGQLLAESLIDWVGFDIKAHPEEYDTITAAPRSAAPALRSLHLLRSSGLPHQLRTTRDPERFGEHHVEHLASWLHEQNLSSEHTWQDARTPA
ncbi:anaerobic ribonucleoside-triphosphate reductase activating protein [Kineosporia babensis]|uniref:Anaerobic ribonucleoside-triphosphate reductase activating protein n=1 Tax=Kineosporia babensis TaxID=499548 RepID=A0A9X1NLG8_9ACTN|nr:anaerobic ribonucleoside-triphosphate reductase activating protein [Kineosporia babensis]